MVDQWSMTIRRMSLFSLHHSGWWPLHSASIGRILRSTCVRNPFVGLSSFVGLSFSLTRLIVVHSIVCAFRLHPRKCVHSTLAWSGRPWANAALLFFVIGNQASKNATFGKAHAGYCPEQTLSKIEMKTDSPSRYRSPNYILSLFSFKFILIRLAEWWWLSIHLVVFFIDKKKGKTNRASSWRLLFSIFPIKGTLVKFYK